jgi:hypothetical protein
MWREEPPFNTDVLTKIDDHQGRRNFRPLRRRHSGWFAPDLDDFVLYSPTHWERPAGK